MKLLTKHKYTLLLSMVVMSLFSFMSVAEQEDYWYFYSGQEIHWKAQPDVFVFRTKQHDQYTGVIASNAVEATTFRNDNPDRLNILFFKWASSQADRDAAIQAVKNDTSFEAEFPAMTMVPTVPYTENLWYFANDLVMVTFKSDSLANANVARMEQQYNLQTYSSPVGLAGGNYSYIFRFSPTTNNNGLVLARALYANEHDILESAEPNLVKIYRDPVDTTVTGVPAQAQEKEQFYVVNEEDNNLRVYFKLHPRTEALTLKIYDLFGRQLYAQTTSTSDNRIKVGISSLSPGLYFASLESSNGKSLFVTKFRKL